MVKKFAALSVACLGLFALLALGVGQYKVFAWDTGIMTWLRGQANPLLDEFFITLTHIGDSIIVIAAAILIAVFLYYKKRPYRAFTVLSLVSGAALANIGFKALFNRPRPELWQHLLPETGFSFPSGHVMLSASLLAAIVIVLWDKPYKWTVLTVAIILAIIVGISRVYIGVHYPSDVLAGWSIVLALAFGLLAVKEKMRS